MPAAAPYEILQPAQRRFLAAFSACYSLTQAARWAKIARQTHYDWLSNDPNYPPCFADAEKRGARQLEDEAVRRAHEGIRKAVRYKGRIVGYETEFSDQLMITMLKKSNPEAFRERTENRNTHDLKVPVNDLVALLRSAPEDGV